MGSLTGIVLLLPSLFFAVVPMVAFLAAYWWLDRYDREPVWLITLTFLWGAIGGVVFGVLNSYTLMMPMLITGANASTQDALGAALIAPLAEEPGKAMFLALVLWNQSFDDAADGFVYGMAAGLGFGMTENFMYFSSVAFAGDIPEWATTVVIRTFYSALMHGCATSLVGAGLGIFRFRGLIPTAIGGLGGLILAMSMHATWNGLLVLDSFRGDGLFVMLDYVLFPIEALCVFAAYQLAVYAEKRTIRRELAEEAAQGLIPGDHPDILASWLRRRRDGWVPAGVDRDRYVRTATQLALRKRQARLLGPTAEFYNDEVDRLRRAIRGLLDRGKAKDQPLVGVGG